MIDQWRKLTAGFDGMSARERAMIALGSVAVMIFLWWHFYAAPLKLQTTALIDEIGRLQQEIKTAESTSQTIERRLLEGVHKNRQQQVALQHQELDRLNELLEKKTYEMVEPGEMFNLMQQMVFSESKLKLSVLKRKRVAPVFDESGAEDDPDQAQASIYRHTLLMSLAGSYADILNYVQRLEAIDRMLIWDAIKLKTAEYPVIQVDLEISTISDNQHWVGL